MRCTKTKYGCAEDLQQNDGKVTKAEVKRAEEILNNAVDPRLAPSGPKYWRDVAVSCRAIELSVKEGGSPASRIPAALISRAEQEVPDNGTIKTFAKSAASSIANVEERWKTERPVEQWTQSIRSGMGQVIRHQEQEKSSYGDYEALDVPQSRGVQGGEYYDNRRQSVPQNQRDRFYSSQPYVAPRRQQNYNDPGILDVIPSVKDANRTLKDVNKFRDLIKGW